MVKVTVISPYYNRKDAVEMTLMSIAAQDFEDFEALIWDDCSQDGTWEELQRVAASICDPRFKIFRHDPNLGFTAGLNYAIALAKGEYIAVVGSGDTCRPDRLTKQFTALEADPQASFCASSSLTIDEETGKQFRDEGHDGRVIELKDIAEACPFTHGTVMYRKSALETVGGYDPVFTWCADWDLFFRLLKGSHARYLPEVLYERYARMDGVSFAPKKSMLQIKCKYLALSLSELDAQGREDMIACVRDKGLDEALSHRGAAIVRDLRARQVKILFMKRRKQANELGALIDVAYGRTLKWRCMVGLASIAAALPIDQDKVIDQARRFKKKFLGAGI